jgi:hypothetical protein
MTAKTIAQLREWAETYNDPKYFEEDPIAFPKEFVRRGASLQDIEIASVFAALQTQGPLMPVADFSLLRTNFEGGSQILLGTELGRGKIDNAKRECDYHIGLSGIISAVLVIFLAVFAKPLVGLFRLNDPAVEQLAVWIVYVFAIKSSMRLYNFMIFCVLRSGGDAKIIQFLDSGLEWSVGLPSAFISVWLGITNIAVVLLITQVEQLVRLVLGMRRVKTYKWAKDLTKTVQ